MATYDPQLVQQIADQVIAAMQATPGSTPGRAPGPAALRPPVGVCTGDYSKFTELRGLPTGDAGEGPAANAPEPPPARDAPAHRPASPPALDGFVTAQQLEAAIKAAPDGVATLAAKARLTPLAADLARQQPQKVRRVDQQPQHALNPKHASPAIAAPWLWWADAHHPAVQALTAEHRQLLRPATAVRSDLGLIEVIGDLARLVEAGRVQGGLLFVRSAARAVCYANRCTTLRAVVGTCAETVDEAVAELGANVLVVEYPYLSPATMGELLKRMFAQPPELPANVARHLTDLHCR